jgi:toxin ParE1/3/4
MTFKVRYSEQAKQDLINIFNHISDVFIEPVTAERQTKRIEKAVESLDFMPFRFRVCDEEPFKSQGVRVFNVDKFLVFYKPDESKNTVMIIRILHGAVNIKNHLSEEN